MERVFVFCLKYEKYEKLLIFLYTFMKVIDLTYAVVSTFSLTAAFLDSRLFNGCVLGGSTAKKSKKGKLEEEERRI